MVSRRGFLTTLTAVLAGPQAIVAAVRHRFTGATRLIIDADGMAWTEDRSMPHTLQSHDGIAPSDDDILVLKSSDVPGHIGKMSSLTDTDTYGTFTKF